MNQDPASGLAGAIRLRRRLDGALQVPRWPAGCSVRNLNDHDAEPVHRLLSRSYGAGRGPPPFEDWWRGFHSDPEFDAGTCVLAQAGNGELAGAALCWSSAFIKDLTVDPTWQGVGLGEALLWHVFRLFEARGARQVDLKVDPDNARARRLYGRVGMQPAAFAG